MTPNEIPEDKKVTTESEIGSNGVGHSKMLGESGGAEEASLEELKLRLAITENQKKAAEAELEKMKAEKSGNSDDSAIKQLAELLEKAIVTKPAGPAEADNINRASDFKERTIIDGNSLMEAQQTMMMYKNEPKEPITIPKSFVSQFGPTLAITVNGVRVSIPVDGRTYYINRTHCLHAKERVAKVDRLLADTEDQVIETNA